MSELLRPSELGADGRPVRQRALRAHNLALALGLVADAATPLSRADIAASTGFTRATASTLVDTLLAGGLLCEVAPARPPRSGRPATGLVLAPDGPGGLGLEVGVDYVATTVVDLAGCVRHADVVMADQRLLRPEQALSRAAAQAVAALDATNVRVCGLAVALPGLADAGHGRVRLAPNLGWREVDALAVLRREPRLAALSMSLDNEANYAALCERYGAAGAHSFVYVSGEVGIGAGLVLEGQLYRGRRGWSGEIGHVTVDPAGPMCTCGARGCLEQYAGQEAILRRAGLDGGAATSLGGEPTVRRIVERAGVGDPAMLVALAEAGHALGVVLAGVVNVLDLDTVVLGGVYAPLAQWVQPVVEQELQARVLWSTWAPLAVRTASVGAEAAVLGAARSVVRGVLADPSRWLVERTPVS